MARYRKLPVIIEAEVYREGLEDGFDYNPDRHNPPALLPYISTLEGKHFISEGDYIITGVKGERYPCKPDIFELTYEPVEMGTTLEGGE